MFCPNPPVALLIQSPPTWHACPWFMSKTSRCPSPLKSANHVPYGFVVPLPNEHDDADAGSGVRLMPTASAFCVNVSTGLGSAGLPMTAPDWFATSDDDGEQATATKDNTTNRRIRHLSRQKNCANTNLIHPHITEARP